MDRLSHYDAHFSGRNSVYLTKRKKETPARCKVYLESCITDVLDYIWSLPSSRVADKEAYIGCGQKWLGIFTGHIADFDGTENKDNQEVRASDFVDEDLPF